MVQKWRVEIKFFRLSNEWFALPKLYDTEKLAQDASVKMRDKYCEVRVVEV
jgi:hypothetical protein